ncbi:MAG TPA: hypothetical protein VMV18_13615 [bacterium]|nr:hypothetical protein [bacterium]
MERVNLSTSGPRIGWGAVASLLGLGVLLFLSQGCANRGSLVSVGFTAGDVPPLSTPTNPDATPTPVPTGTVTDTTPTPTPGSTPTPTATATPDSTPTPTPALACGMVVIRDLRIATDDPNGPTIDFRAWADLDLANPNGSSLNELPVAPGVYRSVTFQMHKRVGSGSGGPGTGNPDVNGSLHLCGTWQGSTFDVFLDVTDTLFNRDPNGVTIDGDGPAKLFVVFDSSHWFDGIDLSTATVAPDGVVYLSHDQNKQMADVFKQNFKTSIRLASHH